MNKKSYKMFYIGIIFILCILIYSSFVLAYTQSYYSAQNNNVMGLGIFSGGQSLRVDDSMCQQGDDFLIQIGPLACTPSPVRSDLLAEENVNVFCQMTATQINPFVDVKRIDSISFQREYPKEVVGIGYQPAQSALGYYTQISESEYSNMEGSLLLQNLGYVVITLKKQPNESALTNCKKDAFGTDICWVEGNLTANLRYDIQNVFGVGRSVFYLPMMEDSDWEKNYIEYSFWEGRGYLRASSVGENDAVLSVYSDNSVASSLLSTGRKYTLARYSSNIPLSADKPISDKIFLPGLSPCLASLQLKLEGVVNPDTRAMIKVNEDYDEVANGETFLDGKCKVSDIEKNGVTSTVNIICSGADLSSERKPFSLSISPRVNLSINGVKKDYSLGDFLYKKSDGTGVNYKEKYIYLGYVGSIGQATDVNNLYVTLVAIPATEKDGNNNKLTASELSSVASWAETAMASPDSGNGALNFASKAFDRFVSTTMFVGKAVLNGENFVNVPYIGAGSAPKNFQGTDVVLGGFFSGIDDGIFPSDNANYTKAMSDFSTVVNSYPNEVEKANSIQSLGEKAMYEKIYLTNALGMKKTVMALCNEFKQSYPDTYLNVGICSNVVKLSSSAGDGKEITVNGVTKIISFDGVKEPSKNDYSAEVIVQGPNNKIISYVLEKNKMIQLTGFRTDDEQKKLTTIEYIKLIDLSPESATVRINVAGKNTLDNVLVSDNKLLNKGESSPPYGGYTFTLKDVHLNKVAKVSVISNQDFARSNSTFNFKIGIEKRLIQLSPEKAKEKIISLNKSMGDWQKASDALYGVVKTMKAACTATGFILTAKNFLANAGGKAIARQTVMGKTGDGGWNDKCAKLVPKTYSTLDACFLHFSDQIEKEVDNTYKIIQLQNTEISNFEKENSGSSDNEGFINGYSKKVVTSLNSANINQVLDSLTAEQKKNLDIDKIKGMLNSDTSFQTYYEKNTYTLDQLKEIELYSTYINQYGSDPNDQTVVNAKKNLISVLSDVYVNSKATIEETTFAQSMGMEGNAIVGSFNSLVNLKEINVDGSNKFLFKNTPYTITNADQSLKDVKLSDTDYAYAIKDLASSPSKTYIVRYDVDGGVAQTYEIIPETSFAKASLKVYIGSDGKNKLNPLGLRFNTIDAASYKNQFKSSYGSSKPLIRYFETVPYKGKPAIVPFDLKEGWYAGINSPQTSYDASGRVVSFYLCNVGKDGIEQFQLENFGGDTCQLINLNTAQTYTVFNTLNEGQIRSLVDRAKNAIEQAQNARARQEGLTSVNGISVGEPPTQSSASQCTDIMSASDCNILFNVCDPVVCPTSRCNLGGNYPVTNVIQTGIIGSIALCYPNAKWNGGDVYVPVCISGVQAGLDNWISIQKSYRDCLQKSIDTGETVGVCDEINSIYTCEFFWKQAVPIIKYAAPKLLGKITGQSGKGGGEYQGITSALDSVKKSIDYFKQYYAANSYNAFKVRSTEQVGTELCGNFASIIYPSSGSFLDNLITPDSPVQFTGKFDEIQQTTATNPPTSQYKVYYHIYAGKDTGVYYTVYLRGSGSSYYQDTAQNRLVKSGYIAKGESADETPDFTAPSGYQQLCIVVNGQEECGFKEVSTSFAVNYLSDLYLAQQASNTSIKTQEECISGTTSILNVLNLNLNAEGVANNIINPQIYAQGIIRICATSDPGVGTDVNAGMDGARWRKVGICGQTGVGCWIDTESVKNVIKTMNIENKAVGDIANGSLQYLNGEYLTADQFSAKMEEINAAGVTSQQKIDMITDIINKVYYSNQKAQLFYNRGKAYSELAISEYTVLAAAKKASDAAVAANGETISQFDKTYISPIFEFQDGTLHTNVCYRYFDSGWHWMIASTGSGTAIIPSCNDPNFPKGRKWFDTTVFKDENDQTPTDKSVSFINSLKGKLYLDGLTLLIQRTMAKNEGGISNPDLLAGDTKMSDVEVFNVDMGSTTPLQTLDYRYSNGWQWSADKIGNNNWMAATIYTVTAGNSKGEKLAQKQIDLLSSIAGKGLYQGAAILFDTKSPELKEFLKDSTTGVGAIETTLDNSFARRDVDKLTNLMNELSTSVFQSSFKCYCDTNCGDYAKWIAETSTINGIPDELLLLAIMIQESSCRSIPSSDGGDNGLMQINTIHCGTKGLPLMDIDACKSILLSDNAQNINIGAQILKEAYRTSSKTYNCNGANLQSYSGWEAALRGYNGWGGTKCGNINYVEEVEAKYFELVNLYNGNPGITCTVGQTKCVGTTYYICLNNAYISQGNVEGKCGYATSSGNVDLSKFSNAELDVITHAASCTNCGKGILNSCDEAECKAIGYYLKRSCLYSLGGCIENGAVTPSDESLKIELTNLLNNKLSSTEKDTVTHATACNECGTKGLFNSCDEQECRALALQLKKKCAYISGTCKEDTTGTTTCTDTCLSLGYKCGIQIICGKSTDCGTCATGQTCNSAGQCVATGSAICTSGQTKCESTTYFTCVNNAWASQGQIDGKCGYTLSGSGTSVEVYMIKPTLLQNILGGINGENIYYKYEGGWKWTPYSDESVWISTISTVVTLGKYTGKIPSSKNVAVIELINGKSFSDGKKIIRDNDGLMKNGTEISILSTVVGCTDTCQLLSYKCGTQTICGKSTDCGNCATDQICNSAGQCVAATSTVCTMLQIKCEGTTYFNCVNNAWVSQGQIDGKCGYTAPTGVCTMPQVYPDILDISDARQKVLKATEQLNGMPALKGSVIKDYDLSGGINCFDSTLYIYNKAGVAYDCAYSDNSGKAYTSGGTQILMGVTKNSAGSVLFQINPNACNTHGLSETAKLDNLKSGDLLSIIYSSTSGHSVIFIKWISDNSHTQAQIFDWINVDANGNRVFGYRTIDLSDNHYSVYMYWDPIKQ